MTEKIVMDSVREYGEFGPVYLDTTFGRLVVLVYNESGYNCTIVDLLDLIHWLKVNRPELVQ